MAEGGRQIGPVTRSGRQVKLTTKMAQLQLENHILQVQLEVSKTEAKLLQLTTAAHHTAQQQVESRTSTPVVDHANDDRHNAKRESIQRESVRPKSVRHESEDRRSAENARREYLPQSLSIPPRHPQCCSTPKDINNEHSDRFSDCHPPDLSTAKVFREDSTLERLVTLLADRQDRLPRMEPEVYSGDTLTFPTWMRSFETLIETHTQSPADRLHYLSKYTAGDAKNCIRGYFALTGHDTYDQAKRVLTARFGDKFRIGEAFKRELCNWPSIKAGDGVALQRLSDFLQHCAAAMATIQYLRCLDNVEENRRILTKLPRYLCERWNRIVDAHMHGPGNGEFPPFIKFCEFITTEARIACGPGNIRQEEPITTTKEKHSAIAHSTGLHDSTEDTRKPYCHQCKGEHDLSRCESFLAMDFTKRKELIFAKGLCFKCLRRGHLSRDCMRNGRHLAYIGLNPPDQSTNQSDKEEEEGGNEAKAGAYSSYKAYTNENRPDERFHSLIIPVSIHHRDKPDIQMRTYAVLDNQSNACFISEDIVNRLELKTKPLNLQLTTMAGSETLETAVANGLVIRGIRESKEVALPGAYMRDHIPVERGLIPRRETLTSWPHLHPVMGKLEPVDNALDIGLLIGFNCSSALVPQEIAVAGDDQPYGVRTILGWGVVGSMQKGASSESEPKATFAYRTHVKEISPSMITEMTMLKTEIEIVQRQIFIQEEMLRVHNEIKCIESLWQEQSTANTRGGGEARVYCAPLLTEQSATVVCRPQDYVSPQSASDGAESSSSNDREEESARVDTVLSETSHPTIAQRRSPAPVAAAAPVKRVLPRRRTRRFHPSALSLNANRRLTVPRKPPRRKVVVDHIIDPSALSQVG